MQLKHCGAKDVYRIFYEACYFVLQKIFSRTKFENVTDKHIGLNYLMFLYIFTFSKEKIKNSNPGVGIAAQWVKPLLAMPAPLSPFESQHASAAAPCLGAWEDPPGRESRHLLRKPRCVLSDTLLPSQHLI